MPTGGSVTLAFQDGASARSYLLRANGIYYFRRDGKGLDLLQQPIPGLSPLPADSPAAKAPAGPPDSLSVIPVKLLADEKEPRVPRLWEKEYRERLAAASAVFEHCCRIRFQVVAVETWNSGDNAHDFLRLLNEFEEKVQPAPARLAIGFTGQYAGLKEDVRMGGAGDPSARTCSSASGAAISPSRSGWKSWYTNWGTTSAPSTRPNHSPSCVPISATGNRGRAVSASVSMPRTR